MSAETVTALIIVATIGVATLAYFMFRRVIRQAILVRHFPPLASREQRTVSLISDPLLVAESASGAKPYESALRQLADEHRALAEEEESVAHWSVTVASAEGEVVDREHRTEKLRDAIFFRKTRVAFANERLRKAKANRDAVAVDAGRVNTRKAEAVAKLRRAESEVHAARDEWERQRSAPAAGRKSAGFIERNTLLVMFHDKVKPKEIKRLLKRYRLTVISGIARLSLFVVRLPPSVDVLPTEEAEATRLRAFADRLDGEGAVATAVQNTVLAGATVPPDLPVAELAGTSALVRHRFPQALRFNTDRGASGSVDVGVLDVGFLPDNDELTITRLPTSEKQELGHGTAVASIIAAKPGNGIGIAGAAAPFANVIGAAPQNGGIFDEFASLLASLLNPKLRLRVINASVSCNWGEENITPATSPDTQKIVVKQGIIVRASLRDASSTVLVTAAGNDCNKKPGCDAPAMWASPYNWAALGPETEEAGPPSNNVIVVEGLNRDATGRLPMSNVGGTIKAIGEDVPAIAKANALTLEDGTSAAAPLVTSAIVLMLQVNPGLTVADIKTNLGILEGLSVPELDAFEAVSKSVPGRRRRAGRFNPAASPQPT